MGGLLDTIARGVGPQVAPYDPQQAALKNAQIGVAQQSIQTQALENQQRMMDMRDAASTRLYIQKHNGNFESMLQDPEFMGAVQPHTAIALQKSILDNQDKMADTLQKRATAQQHTADAEKATREMEADTAYTLQQSNYNPAAVQANIVHWQNQGILDPQTAQAALQHISDPVATKQLIDQIAMASPTRIKDLETQAKTQEANTKTAAEKRDQAKADIENPGLQAKAQREQLVTGAMKDALTDPTKGEAAIDAAIPNDPQANAGYKAAYRSAMGLGNTEMAASIIKTAAEHGASLSPAKTAVEVNKAVQVEKATAPLKIAQQVAAARAMRAGDNPALESVAPADIPRVNSTAQKLDQDYISAKTAAQDVATVLQLAQSGNKAAGANVPLVGVGALNAVNGIKRINSAEIHQYGTAGSLLDKIQGKLQGWTEGQPIPKDVLTDMQSLHDQIATGSWDKYTTGLGALNTRSGAKLTPAVEQYKPAVSAAPKVRARDPQGQLHEATAGTPLPAGWKPEK